MSTPQTTYHIPGSEQEPFAPSGTKIFTHEERIDLHKSDLPLAELTRVAADLATPMHQVSEADAKDIDTKRVEFGGNVVTTLSQDRTPQEFLVRPSAEILSLTDPLALAKIGEALVFLRAAQARPDNPPQEY